MADGADAITAGRAARDDLAAVTACDCAACLPWIAAVGRQPGPMLQDDERVLGHGETGRRVVDGHPCVFMPKPRAPSRSAA